MLSGEELERDSETARRTVPALVGAIVVLIGLYAPFVFFTELKLSTIGFPGIRAIAIWLTLPGFGLGVFAKPVFDDIGMFTASGIVTIALGFSLWRLSRRSVSATIAAILLALAVSVPTAFFVHRLFAS